MRTNLVIAFIAMTAATYFSRAFFTVSVSQVRLSPSQERYLSFIPFAVLTAMVAPYLFLPGSSPSLSLVNPWVLAGGLTLFVSWRTKSLLLSVGSGITLFLILGKLL